jgi:phosphoenolpyruvate synthase/pyruvate phosphate dikinase
MNLGGKAEGLLRLQRHVSVPPFVVTSSHDITADEAYERLLARIDDAEITPPYAVRSSATAEDSAVAAFAGQFETLLDVARADLRDAIRSVLESVDRPRVHAYAAAMRVTAGTEINVIVQKMLDARAAGVALYPTTAAHGSDGRVVVEAIHGLGDLLVDGREEPMRWATIPQTKIVEVVAQGRQAFMHTRDGGIQRVPMSLRGLPPLSTATVTQLASDVMGLRQAFGWARIDVEFAVAAGELWYLQARPLLADVQA